MREKLNDADRAEVERILSGAPVEIDYQENARLIEEASRVVPPSAEDIAMANKILGRNPVVATKPLPARDGRWDEWQSWYRGPRE